MEKCIEGKYEYKWGHEKGEIYIINGVKYIYLGFRNLGFTLKRFSSL